jgi:hypothetical protein
VVYGNLSIGAFEAEVSVRPALKTAANVRFVQCLVGEQPRFHSRSNYAFVDAVTSKVPKFTFVHEPNPHNLALMTLQMEIPKIPFE